VKKTKKERVFSDHKDGH